MFSSPIFCRGDHTNRLQKLVNKEYTRLTGESPEEAKAADAENDGDAGSGDEAGKKKKTPNLSRTLKSRLQKLVDKTADEYALPHRCSRICTLTSFLQWTRSLC